jgi:hypothetical protein
MKSTHWHWLGVGLSSVGVAYLIQRLMGQADGLPLADMPATSWWVVGALSLLYAASNGFLAHAWWELLRHQRAAPGWFQATKIYGLSQLAKYVPGNLFHFVGRQAMGLAQGIPGRALVKSAGLELWSLALGACLFTAWLLHLFWPAWNVGAGTALFCVCFVVLVVGFNHFVSPQLAHAFVAHCLFLGFSATMFVATFVVLTDHPDSLQVAPLLGAAYVVAWLVGLATPGAPAGLGVRETALVLLLEGSGLPQADLLMAVLFARCITVFGDVLFFLWAWRLPVGASSSSP